MSIENTITRIHNLDIQYTDNLVSATRALQLGSESCTENYDKFELNTISHKQYMQDQRDLLLKLYEKLSIIHDSVSELSNELEADPLIKD